MLLALPLVWPMGARADSAPSSNDIQTMRQFRLTDDFLDHWENYNEDVAEDPCRLGLITLFQNKKDQTLDQMAAQYDAEPGVHKILERNDLTARQVILGTAVLMGAAMEVIAEKHPGLVKQGKIHVNPQTRVAPENLAFYKAHAAEIHSSQRALAKHQLDKNGGKLPDCLNGGS